MILTIPTETIESLLNTVSAGYVILKDHECGYLANFVLLFIFIVMLSETKFKFFMTLMFTRYLGVSRVWVSCEQAPFTGYWLTLGHTSPFFLRALFIVRTYRLQ